MNYEDILTREDLELLRYDQLQAWLDAIIEGEDE